MLLRSSSLRIDRRRQELNRRVMNKEDAGFLERLRVAPIVFHFSKLIAMYLF